MLGCPRWRVLSSLQRRRLRKQLQKQSALRKKHLRKKHSIVKVLHIWVITAADGSKREVDGAVVADGCAAIVEAKQELDDDAVGQLWSCLEFISDNELAGPAAQLKGKKLLGFVAGRTLSSNPGRVKALVRDCQRLGYGILFEQRPVSDTDQQQGTTTLVGQVLVVSPCEAGMYETQHCLWCLWLSYADGAVKL